MRRAVKAGIPTIQARRFNVYQPARLQLPEHLFKHSAWIHNVLNYLIENLQVIATFLKRDILVNSMPNMKPPLQCTPDCGLSGINTLHAPGRVDGVQEGHEPSIPTADV